jgi:hypothetical protein
VDCEPTNPLLSLPVEAEPGLPTVFVASPTYMLSRSIPVAEADCSAWVIREHFSVRFSINLLIGSPVSDFFPQRLNRESQRLAVRVGNLRRNFGSRPRGPSGVAGRKEAGDRLSKSYPQPYPASAHGVDRLVGYFYSGSPQAVPQEPAPRAEAAAADRPRLAMSRRFLSPLSTVRRPDSPQRRGPKELITT